MFRLRRKYSNLTRTKEAPNEQHCCASDAKALALSILLRRTLQDPLGLAGEMSTQDSSETTQGFDHGARGARCESRPSPGVDSESLDECSQSAPIQAGMLFRQRLKGLKPSQHPLKGQ
jgi:hypothetical protein